MANASKKHFGPGAHGKGDGSGAQTMRAGAQIGANSALSNRDKSDHPKSRGQDGRRIQTDQLQDTEYNQGGE